MSRFILLFFLLVAFLIRFVGITHYPVGFNADEASFGYDAYSIIHTGRDQWGNFLPLTLKSFGDYKAPLYSYLTIPFVKLIGLNVFAVRLPNVIIGTLAVLTTYLLTLELLKDKKVALISALLLAVNPWSVMMSRGAFEANLVTFFVPLGIYLFLRKKYIFSSLIFGMGLFTYHSAKLIIPIIFFALLFIFKKEIKKILPSILLFLVFMIGLIYTFTAGGGARAAERSIFRGAQLQGAEERIKLINNGGNPILTKLIHNKYQVTLNRFVSNYKQYVSPRFLFVKGVAEGSYGMIPGIGVFYIIEGILFLGLIPLALYQKKLIKPAIAILGWVLVSILPAALATGVGYAGNRAEGMIPGVQILGGLGLAGWLVLFKRFDKKLIVIFVVLFCLIAVKNIYNFSNKYFRYSGNSVASSMGYGNLELSKWLVDRQNGKEVIISRGLGEPQIFIAFANSWDPAMFQDDTKKWQPTTWVDQIPEYHLRNFTFKSVDWSNDVYGENHLIVSKATEFPKTLIPDKIFYFPDGTANIYVKTF